MQRHDADYAENFLAKLPQQFSERLGTPSSEPDWVHRPHCFPEGFAEKFVSPKLAAAGELSLINLSEFDFECTMRDPDQVPDPAFARFAIE